jgi:ATP-dependent RNA helicase RhlB
MNDPVKVAVAPEQVTAEKIEHVVYHVGQREKFPLLLGLLQHDNPERSLIFVNTKREAEWLGRRLGEHDFHVQALTGDLNQRARLRVMREFKSGELPILVATDVASRGLHVENVTHVFNYDVPQDPEDYVHRIGRTARAGNSGKAVTLACENYVMALEGIEKLIGFKLPMAHVEDEMLVRPKPSQRRHHGPPPERRHSPREAQHDGKSDGKSNGQRRRGRRRGGGATPASKAQTTG